MKGKLNCLMKKCKVSTPPVLGRRSVTNVSRPIGQLGRSLSCEVLGDGVKKSGGDGGVGRRSVTNVSRPIGQLGRSLSCEVLGDDKVKKSGDGDNVCVDEGEAGEGRKEKSNLSRSNSIHSKEGHLDRNYRILGKNLKLQVNTTFGMFTYHTYTTAGSVLPGPCWLPAACGGVSVRYIGRAWPCWESRITVGRISLACHRQSHCTCSVSTIGAVNDQ